MGMPYNAACVTCKKEYYLGYGGGRRKEYLEARFPAKEHEGHDVVFYSEDYTTHVGDDLHISHMWTEDEPMIVGHRLFEQINLSGE